MKNIVKISVVSLALVFLTGMVLTWTSTAPSAILVFAGHDRTICFSQDLRVSDLNATISGDVSNGDWISFGDGRFQPGNLLTVRYNTAQSQQVTYVPGPNDRALGFFRLMLLSDAPVGNPLERVTDEVRINFQPAPPLFCSNNVNISLNETCTQVVDATMLQPNPVQPYSNYIITLYNANGTVIPNNTLTHLHVDNEITYKLGHQCTANFCWGKLKVEDYFPPVFVCKNDTISCLKSILPDSLGFPFPAGAYIDTLISNKYTVKNWDKCSDVILEYTDTTIKGECSRNEDKIVSRRWKAADAKGNTSFCTEVIVVRKIALSDVIFPPNFEGHDMPAFECGDSYPKLINGNPSPDTTGTPLTGHCGHLQFNFSDVPFSLCGNSYKIARSWFLIDWCTSLSVTKNQIIQIKDSQGPSISFQDTLRWQTDPYICATGRVEIPALESAEDCSAFDTQIEIINKSGQSFPSFIQKVGSKFFVDKLPLDAYEVRYIVTDVCNNTTVGTSELIISDLTPPYPACDGVTKVALDQNGRSRVFALSFDDGSTDNCGIASFKARKMQNNCGIGTAWGDFVDFCCDEIGTTQMVALEVTDIHGNKNTCMVEVIVEDKIKPTLTCPPNITLACTDSYDFANLQAFGNVVTQASQVKNVIVHNFYHNGIVGQDGLARDNCSVSVTSKYRTNIECHTGFIYRTFTATDAGGRVDSCTQVITILNPDPFDQTDITWPSHYESNGCRVAQANPDITGFPKFKNTSCGNITHSYEDQPFYIADGACVKIVRTWTVVDWCQFDQVTGRGKYGPYVQTIKLHNTDKPWFMSSCADTTICSYAIDCGLTNITLDAFGQDSCTQAKDLVWKYELDIHSDGILDFNGTASTYSGNVPMGVHSIKWILADQCGNLATCLRKVTVADCKKPSPYCITSLTQTLDAVQGTAEIWAKDFDKGSSDNCTSKDGLIFTFNGARPVSNRVNVLHYFKENGILSTPSEYLTGLAQVWKPNTKSAGILFDCSDIPDGKSQSIPLKMTVFDSLGNSDFCEVELILQDNSNKCPDLITHGTVSGKVNTENNKAVSDVQVHYQGVEIDDYVMTNSDGVFSIESLPLQKEYSIKPYKDINPLEGVTALDLVHIQRHILGITLLDSPFKMIAADANASKSITAGDLLEIRRLILGITDKFPKGLPSWVFVAKNGISNPQNPFSYQPATMFTLSDAVLQNQDFTAVKIGDVNNSAVNIQEEMVESRNAVTPFLIEVSSEKVNEENVYEFRAGSDAKFDAIQLFLHTDAVANDIIVAKHETVNPELDWHLVGNTLRLVMYQTQTGDIQKGDILFSIPAPKTSTFRIDDTFENIFYGENRERPIQLKSISQSPKAKLKLRTNPVMNELVVQANDIQQATGLTYEIVNTEGKVLLNGLTMINSSWDDVYITLPESIQPGIYFVKLSLDDWSETLKFIRIQ